jgi:hypothetical protein
MHLNFVMYNLLLYMLDIIRGRGIVTYATYLVAFRFVFVETFNQICVLKFQQNVCRRKVSFKIYVNFEQNIKNNGGGGGCNRGAYIPGFRMILTLVSFMFCPLFTLVMNKGF